MSPPGAEGAAADAIRTAETALARQNSVAAHVDLEVVTAVLNAHAAHADGAAALNALQAEIEAAITTRTALDTPTGAREFQRYLIDKLKDIRTVVEQTDLDDTSKAGLAAALASLYASSGSVGAEAAESGPALGAAPPPPAAPAPPLPDRDAPKLSTGTDSGSADIGSADFGFADSGPLDFGGPGLEPEPAAEPAVAAPSPAAAVPALPTMPSLGGGLPGLSPLAGLNPLTPLSALADPGEPEDSDADEELPPATPEDDVAEQPDGPDPGYTDVIAEAVSGTPIADAFDHHGVTIPGPGTSVATPLAATDVVAGDIGVFDDRHALALGNGKALLDDQIQPIENLNRPGFIGWQHPPEPDRHAEPD